MDETGQAEVVVPQLVEVTGEHLRRHDKAIGVLHRVADSEDGIDGFASLQHRSSNGVELMIGDEDGETTIVSGGVYYSLNLFIDIERYLIRGNDKR
jgi:hypothetical protein